MSPQVASMSELGNASVRRPDPKPGNVGEGKRGSDDTVASLGAAPQTEIVK